MFIELFFHWLNIFAICFYLCCRRWRRRRFFIGFWIFRRNKSGFLASFVCLGDKIFISFWFFKISHLAHKCTHTSTPVFISQFMRFWISFTVQKCMLVCCCFGLCLCVSASFCFAFDLVFSIKNGWLKWRHIAHIPVIYTRFHCGLSTKITTTIELKQIVQKAKKSWFFSFKLF